MRQSVTLYQIRDWDKYFENAGSRSVEHCSWCPIPNKQDGLGYTLLTQGRNGAARYGAFVAILLVASKQEKPRNGWLTDNGKPDGKPFTIYQLSLKTRLPEKILEETLLRVSQPDIDWIVAHSPSSDSTPIADYQQSDSTPGRDIDITERTERTERKERKDAATEVPATFIELARTFLEMQKKRFPKESALKDFETRVTTGACNLYLFHTRDNWIESEIRDLLDWVLEDEFWSMQIRTLGGIRNRKRGKGSAMKFENAKAAMEMERNLKKQKSVMEMLEEIEDESKATN